MDIKDLLSQDLFFKENFNVDECLSKYTHKSDLETLRQELKGYGAELQQQMSDILKTETEAIVNLAEHLTNLQIKIENLQQPILQLKEEILSLYNLTKNAEQSYDRFLKNMKRNNTTQSNIQLKQGLLSSAYYIENFLISSNDSLPDLLTLEHMVNKFSFQKYYMEVLNIITPDIGEIIKTVDNKLIKIVNNYFIQSLNGKQLDILCRCLRLYSNLARQNIAHETFRIYIVKPYLDQVLTEKRLEKSQQDLDKIYKEVLEFVHMEIDLLHDIINSNLDLQSFNFMLHSFWKEFDRQSRLGLPYITAPGNPELFRKRFSSTFHILRTIAIKCGNENLLREDETFQEHIRRFNLPVYFEIQYQKIAGQFETEVVDKNKMYAQQNPLSCKLKPTLALYVGVAQCFHEDVFIDQLADQFLKLSLLLLSRYLKWFNQHLKEVSFPNTSAQEIFTMDALFDLNLVEHFLALDTNDIQDVNNTFFSIVNDNMKAVIIKSFHVNRKCISDTQNQLKIHLIEIKLQESVSHLQSVGAIPRLYRRTNRSAPKEASSYVVEAIKPVLKFQKDFCDHVTQHSQDICRRIIKKMTNHYHLLVQDVLKSVCKTENSLRRLKSRNVTVSEETSTNPETVSDETKIREQIKFDVKYFYDKLYPLACDDTKSTMNLLKQEI